MTIDWKSLGCSAVLVFVDFLTGRAWRAIFFFAIAAIINGGQLVIALALIISRVSLRVLYDGWPLVHAPLSGGAAHLRTLLAAAPDGAEMRLALPEQGEVAGLPVRVQVVTSTPKDRGEWEQQRLPQLAAEHRATCIHTTAQAAPLFSKTPVFASPAEVGSGGRGRLAAAQARGGLARATSLWPADLPQMPGSHAVLLPPVADLHRAGAGLPTGTPPEYLLYLGSGERKVLLDLLESWTWGAASIGELYPLLVAGLDDRQADWLRSKLPDFHLEDYVQIVSPDPAQLQSLIEACTAFAHPQPLAAWGSALRLALACGKAVVALQEPLTEAMAGSAAYLVAAGDLRSFGAAMITVVVEESVRTSLEQQARQKSARWDASAFRSSLAELYRSLEPAPR